MSATPERAIDIAVDHPAFDGHFPGQPLLPGVALLAEVLEAARADLALRNCIGPAPRLAVAKFLAPVRPGASLDIDFRLGESTLAWTVREGTRVVASGQFARQDRRGEVSS
jgi:3-hydroxymyristoyl/3-hydroxydecanoyl-(acyl carrier protein) dehydratase